MVQLNVLSGKSAGRSWAVRRFPFLIGRAEGNHLILDDAGVWPEHLSLTSDPVTGIQVHPGSSALLTVNAQSVDRAWLLRNGDVIALGAVKVQFSLSAPLQRGLRVRETLVWGLLLFLLALQVLLFCRLPH